MSLEAGLLFCSGILFGFIGHELAHWIVLKAIGIQADFSLIPPQVSFDTPARVPVGVRVAAVAPAIAGSLLLLASLALIGILGAGIIAFAAGACSRLFHLSPADRRLALGNPAN